MNDFFDALWSEILLLLVSAFFGIIFSLGFGSENILWCIWGCAVALHVLTVVYYAIQEAWINRKARHSKEKYYSRYIH